MIFVQFEFISKIQDSTESTDNILNYVSAITEVYIKPQYKCLSEDYTQMAFFVLRIGI